MDKLKDFLQEYKKISSTLYESIEGEAFDNLDELLNTRQEVIDNIQKLQYSKEDFAKLVKDLELIELQNKLDKAFQSKRASVLDDIKKISATKNVENSYNNPTNYNSFFFNKKY